MAIVTPIRRNVRVRHPNRQPQTRSEAHAAMAAIALREWRWTPAQMQAAELTLLPSAPVAAAMRELAAAR